MFAALATSPLHHLFFRTFEVRQRPTFGPLYYTYLAYAYPMVLAGIGLLLLAARRMWSTAAWQRAALLTTAALLPTAVSLLFVFDVLPIFYDPTPASLAVSLGILTFGVFRHQLLEALPLARGDVIDHLREGVVIADAAGRAVDANPGALAILGCSRAELRGARLGELLAPLAPNAAALELLCRRFEAPEPDDAVAPLEVSTKLDRRIEVSAMCLRAPNGGALGRFAVLRDRTDERRTEGLLRQSLELETVGSLVAGVAHEINNPLAFVQANLSQLEQLAAQVAKRLPLLGADRDAEELAELPQLVAECTEGIDRVRRILDSMRRFSRMNDEFGAVDVNRVLEGAIRLAELHRNRDVLVQPLLEPGLPAVHGSASRLEQVFRICW